MVFSGTVGSDFMKLARLPVSKKKDLIDFASDIDTLREEFTV